MSARELRAVARELEEKVKPLNLEAGVHPCIIAGEADKSTATEGVLVDDIADLEKLLMGKSSAKPY